MEYDKVDKYFKNKEKQEEKAKQCAVQANFLKEMREKTAKEVEKASNTIIKQQRTYLKLF